MGFFSWKTSDAGKSIPNRYCESKSTFPIVMVDNKGNYWIEENYEGYGVFGGKDYYELVAEMNNCAMGETNKDRLTGINLIFEDNPSGSEWECYKRGIKLPVIVHKDYFDKYVDSYVSLWEDLPPAEICDSQGYFYD